MLNCVRVYKGSDKGHAHIAVALGQLELVSRHVLLKGAQREPPDGRPAQGRRQLHVDIFCAFNAVDQPDLARFRGGDVHSCRFQAFLREVFLIAALWFLLVCRECKHAI